MPDLFKPATSTQYRNMVQRFAAKYNTAGELKKPGREVPFTLAQYREWLADMMQTTRGIRCAYCGRPLPIQAVSPDHIQPVKRGGGLNLENLAASCQDCNRAKGELEGVEFKALLKGLETFPAPARNYVLKCLRSAAMGARMRFFPREKAKGAKPSAARSLPVPHVKSSLFQEEF